MSRPAWVYRAYDADGRLLYVGCTAEVGARLSYHAQHAPWWIFHSAITTEQFDSEAAARDAELEAIATEYPRWNVVGRSPDHPDGPVSRATGLRSAPWLWADVQVWRRWKAAA